MKISTIEITVTEKGKELDVSNVINKDANVMSLINALESIHRVLLDNLNSYSNVKSIKRRATIEDITAHANTHPRTYE